MTESLHHDGETLAQAIERRREDWRHPFRRNPMARNRYGWLDLIAGHALTNVSVTAAREQPRTYGHWVLYGAIAAAVVIVSMAAALFVGR